MTRGSATTTIAESPDPRTTSLVFGRGESTRSTRTAMLSELTPSAIDGTPVVANLQRARAEGAGLTFTPGFVVCCHLDQSSHVPAHRGEHLEGGQHRGERSEREQHEIVACMQVPALLGAHGKDLVAG